MVFLRNISVYTQHKRRYRSSTHREVTTNRRDTIIKKKEKARTLVDVAISADRNVVQQEVGTKLKYVQEFRYRDTTNVEPEVYNYSSNNDSHWNSKENLNEKFGKIYQENIR